ncbi:MAG: recombinase family protein [Bryobacteraceae bacterium]
MIPVRWKESATPKTGAVVYCRVSTEEQAGNFSLETQERECRRYCEREGLTVLEVFSEAESAKSLDRDRFMEMLHFCRKNHKTVGAVVVYNVSRFSRQAHDHQVVRSLLSGLRINLRSATEPIGETPFGRLNETMMSAWAQFDNEVKAERTKAGMEAAARAGKWPFRAPIGYVNLPVGKGKITNLGIDAERAPLIRKAFELCATGDYSKADVLRTVTELGLTVPDNGRPLSAQTFDKLLRNPLYVGYIVIPSWKLAAKGTHEPIVEPELFELVQARMNGDATPAQQSVCNEDFPLRVFVKCEHCETGLTGSFSRGRHGKRYPYYSCRVTGCGLRFRQVDLHKGFMELLDRIQLREGFVAVCREAIKGVWQRKKDSQDDLAKLAVQRRAELKDKEQKLIDAVVNKTISKEIFDDQMGRVRTDLEKVNDLETQALIQESELEDLLEFADWFVQNASVAWFRASAAVQRRIQGALFPEGLTASKEGLRTPSTLSLLMSLAASDVAAEGLASPGGFEPPLPP